MDIVLSYDVPSDPAGAFSGFVEDFGTWWPRAEGDYGSAAFSGGTGGVIEIPSPRGAEVLGEVTEWEPPEHLAWRHRWRHSRDVSTQVTLAFTESEWGTRVRLTHAGWEELEASEKEKFADWPLILWHYVAHMRVLAPHEDAA